MIGYSKSFDTIKTVSFRLMIKIIKKSMLKYWKKLAIYWI